jgi:predicted permease
VGPNHHDLRKGSISDKGRLLRRLRALMLRVRSLFARRRLDVDLAEELESHLQLHIDDNIRAGMAPDKARRQAIMKLGGIEQTKERYRDRRGFRPVEQLVHDIRYAARLLRKDAGFTTVAVLSLALGIGANTAIFSLLDQVLLRPLPVHNPEELVYLYSDGPRPGSSYTDEPGGPSFSYPLFRELQKAQTPFVGLASAQSRFVSLAFKNHASYGHTRFVSGNYFDLLGVRPAVGRLLTETDDRTPGAHSVVVLSYGYWSSRFGKDVSVLNQTILVNSVPMTIVGVAQKGFKSERLNNPPAVYVPITMWDVLTPDSEGLANRKSAWFTMVGRLKPGMTRERAELEINVPFRAQLEQDVQLLDSPSDDFLQRFRARRITLAPGQRGRGTLDEEWGTPLLLLMGMTLLVLLIACANVANLQLARGIVRAREVVVRTAMGASRMQLVRQFLTGSCLLAVAGGALGVMVARWTQHAIVVSLPPRTGVQDLELATLDGRILFFCLGLSLVTGILFGLFPALQASKTDLTSSLKDQAGQILSTGRTSLFRRALVMAQLAVSLLLLISAGLFANTLVNVARVDPGIRTDHLMTFSIGPKLNGYTDERIARLHEQLKDRLSRIPGVVLVSSAWMGVITDSTSRMSISVEGHTPPNGDSAWSNYNRVGADYFRTMGTPLVAGREFTRADNASAPPVAIVNEAFVRQFLPNQNPLGRHLGSGRDETPLTAIIGVVKNAKFSRMREDATPTFYRPLQQSDEWDSLCFYLRTTIPPESTLPLIRHHLAALDSSLPIGEAKTMEAQIEESLFAERILSFLTGAFAALAVLLAAIGLYGMLAYNIARRTREIGIRMALGADAGDVRALVVREVAVMLVVGTVIGLASAAAASQLVQSFLYGLQPRDTLTYGLAVVALWLVALGAAGIPTRRATRVDPMQALRCE